MLTLLGFDFGRQRIGVAVGQQVTGTATALCTLPSSNGAPDWPRITALIEEWQPQALVVGLPLHADGSDSESSRAARKFAEQLKGRYRLPVHMMNEALSSHAATGVTRKNSRRNSTGLDAVAARVILQDWLDNGTS